MPANKADNIFITQGITSTAQPSLERVRKTYTPEQIINKMREAEIRTIEPGDI